MVSCIKFIIKSTLTITFLTIHDKLDFKKRGKQGEIAIKNCDNVDRKILILRQYRQIKTYTREKILQKKSILGNSSFNKMQTSTDNIIKTPQKLSLFLV